MKKSAKIMVMILLAGAIISGDMLGGRRGGGRGGGGRGGGRGRFGGGGRGPGFRGGPRGGPGWRGRRVGPGVRRGSWGWRGRGWRRFGVGLGVGWGPGGLYYNKYYRYPWWGRYYGYPYWYGSYGPWLSIGSYYTYPDQYPIVYNQTGIRIKFYISRRAGQVYDLTIQTEDGQTKTFEGLDMPRVEVGIGPDGQIQIAPR